MVKLEKDLFLNEYKKEKNKSELRNESYDYFYQKYILQSDESEWIFDQNTRKDAIKIRKFLPGRIYMYEYDPLGKDILDYYDKRPMIYVLGDFDAKTKNNIIQGINLNFLPELVKVYFLNTVFNTFSLSYGNANNQADENKIDFMKEIWLFVNNWQFMTNVFNKTQSIGIDFAIRNYIYDRIYEPIMIEIEDFSYIPYYISKEMEGTTIGQLYNLYNEHRKLSMNKTYKSINKNKIAFNK